VRFEIPLVPSRLMLPRLLGLENGVSANESADFGPVAADSHLGQFAVQAPIANQRS
jgi:hypothetical protein